MSVLASTSCLPCLLSVEGSQHKCWSILKDTKVVDVPVHPAPLGMDILIPMVLILDMNFSVEEHKSHYRCHYHIDDGAEVVDAATLKKLLLFIAPSEGESDSEGSEKERW